MDGDPLRPPRAREVIHHILNEGVVDVTGHAKKELKKDGLIIGDAINVLSGGIVEEAEWENGDWRYRVRTSRIVVVVALNSETKLTVITAWKLKS